MLKNKVITVIPAQEAPAPTPETCSGCAPRDQVYICPVTGTENCPPNTTAARRSCTAC